MSQYILIKNISVQNANAVAGFTWGFPAITHFLGFTHNLSRKLIKSKYSQLFFSGCAVISHDTKVHTYGDFDKQFTQSRNPPYLLSHDKKATPPVIEEGKMNMTVSLLISYEGYLGQNKQDDFKQWLLKNCLLQRLAGGSILEIEALNIFDLSNNKEATSTLRVLKRQLLPGFILIDKSHYLKDHYHDISNNNPQAELLDAWFDFITLKQKARPKSNLIASHLNKLTDENNELSDIWIEHLKIPYVEDATPEPIKNYFSELLKPESVIKNYKALLQQWENYCHPTDKTDADWEYMSKPKKGYLVPIMAGYKAISKVYEDNSEVENTRDDKTPVCFVEAIHSIGEWMSVHRIKDPDSLSQAIWKYKPYEKGLYLCTQEKIEREKKTNIENNSPLY